MANEMLRKFLPAVAGAAAMAFGGAASASVMYDFESGAQGWTIGAENPSVSGNATAGRNNWALGGSLPGSTGVTLGGTWWTNPNNGDLGTERSFVLSPVLTVQGSATTISFDSYSSNEGGYPNIYDVEHIQLAVNGGAFADVHGALLSTLHVPGDQTFRNFSFTSAGLGAGDQVQYRFLYDTYDGCCGTAVVTGWAFDNVMVAGVVGVPEPMTVLLLGAGLVGVGWVRKRRR